MQLYQHNYLLVGAAVHCFKAACGLHKPEPAGLKTETHWNNRTTPLPPGLSFLLCEENGGSPPHLSIQQANRPDVHLDYGGEDIGEWALGQGKRFGLPLCQPSNTTGLSPDVRIQAYEECYQHGNVTLRFRQGIVYFALDQAGEWAFIGSEPQATYLTLSSCTPRIKTRLRRALASAAALPTISPALHAQQLSRMQAWWWGGVCPTNRPVAEQIPQLANVELESKLAVADDFSTTCWRLSDAIQQEDLVGFTAYQDPLWVRHSHNMVRYLKGKQKLTLQGATHRFSKKSLGSGSLHEGATASGIKIRQESKPLYSPIATFVQAQGVMEQAEQLNPLGDLYCHKRKFLLQSKVTGGGYHVLIDHSSVPAQPGQTLTQIEIECQWQKVPPRDPISDPFFTAIAEIEQLTQAVSTLLPDLQPTLLGKRGWLKSVVEQ